MRRLVAVLFVVFGGFSLFAQTLPTGFSRVQVGVINNPTVMAFAPDGRLFVAEQTGILRVIKNDQLLATPFMSLVVNSVGERGLIGIAFDPAFATNNFIYVYYTVPATTVVPIVPVHNRISRFTANGDVVVPGSEQIILELDNLNATNHNGGALAFGKDGYLYVAIGENAVTANAQNLDTYHGKFLRINKDGSAAPDNPLFATGTDRGKRFWAWGLRNPYTFSIHPITGRIFINDVGQSSWEEVDDATTGGKNFGWPATEGNINPPNPNYTGPVFTYPRVGNPPNGCAITGGTFFFAQNSNYPSEYYGKYYIVDFCSNWIYYFDPAQTNPTPVLFGSNIGGSSLSIIPGPDGNLYYMSRALQRVYRIVYTPPVGSPAITAHPQPVTVNAGQSASFSVTATGTAPLSYQWLRSGSTLTGKTEATLTIPATAIADGGNYYATVSNSLGTVTSNQALLTVNVVNTPNNQPPTAVIVKPTDATKYVAGTAIAFEGTGTDPEDGNLTGSSLSWAINFHHDTHRHDQPAISGLSGSFDVPNRGETSSNVWYRFILTATDAGGLKGKDSVDVHPLTSKLTFATIPAGLQVTVDGQPVTTPTTITSVEGLLRDVSVTQQAIGDDTFSFASWSQGGAATQTITTPTDDVTYTANFSVVTGVENLGEAVVYPNPAEGVIYITDAEINSVIIINSVGKSSSLVCNRGEVDVTQLAPGMYVLLYAGKKTKLIIK